jgi:hypothetical protein
MVRSEWQIRGNILTLTVARAGQSHKYSVDRVLQRKRGGTRLLRSHAALPLRGSPNEGPGRTGNDRAGTISSTWLKDSVHALSKDNWNLSLRTPYRESRSATGLVIG